MEQLHGWRWSGSRVGVHAGLGGSGWDLSRWDVGVLAEVRLKLQGETRGSQPKRCTPLPAERRQSHTDAAWDGQKGALGDGNHLDSRSSIVKIAN